MRGSIISGNGFVPVCLFLFVCYVLRDIHGAFAPPLFNEDGPNMLDFYTDGHEPWRIVRFYGGYVSIGPNLIGYLTGFLPTPVAIHMLYWVPLGISALTFAALCHPAFDLPGLTDRERNFTAIFLGLFPAGNMALFTNTTFSLWHFAILLFFICLLCHPRTWFGAGLCAGFCLIAATSHPVSILLLPVLVWRIWQARTVQERWAFLPVLVIIPVYILLGVASSGVGTELQILPTLWEAMRLFLERGVFETLFGTPPRLMLLYRGLEAILWVVVLAILGLMFWQARRGVRILVSVLLLLGFGNSFFSAVIRDIPLTVTWGHRYGYLTGVLFLLAAALSFLPAIRDWPRPGNWGATAFRAALAGAAVISLALKLPYYRNEPVWGAEVGLLMTVLEDRPAPYCLHVERAEWSFEIREGQPSGCVTLPPISR